MFRTHSRRAVAALFAFTVTVTATTAVSTLNADAVSVSPGRISSTVINPAAVVSWSSTRWDQEFTLLKGAHITNLVLQQSVGQSTPTATAYYPSAIPQTHGAVTASGGSPDVLTQVLSRARTAGMKVWIGLYSDTRSVRFSPNSTLGQILLDDAALSKKIAAEISAKYGQYGSTIAGWYLPAEINTNYFFQPALGQISAYFKDVVTYLHSGSVNRPVMISPFFHDNAGVSASQFTQQWTKILSAAPIDIVALQDGVGDVPGSPPVRSVVDTRLKTWFGAMRSAITASHQRTKLWDNVDLYSFTGGPALIGDIANNAAATSSIVDGYTSFSFTNQISSWTLGTDSYYVPFVTWNVGGVLSRIAPSTPGNLKITATTSGASLSWTASKPAPGQSIAFYRIYAGSPMAYVSTVWGTTASISRSLICPRVIAYDTIGNASPAASTCGG